MTSGNSYISNYGKVIRNVEKSMGPESYVNEKKSRLYVRLYDGLYIIRKWGKEGQHRRFSATGIAWVARAEHALSHVKSGEAWNCGEAPWTS